VRLALWLTILAVSPAFAESRSHSSTDALSAHLPESDIPKNMLRRIVRDSGKIFAGTVLKIERADPGPTGHIAITQITFRVEDAIRGVKKGQVVRVNEWGGLWQNPTTPVGAQASSPFTLMVVTADGVTPVAGASVQFTSSAALAFSACGGLANCTVLTDQSGIASTSITVLSLGITTITARLAPASYPNPQQVQTTVLGTSSQL